MCMEEYDIKIKMETFPSIKEKWNEAVLIPIKTTTEVMNKSRPGCLKFPFNSVLHKEQET